MEIGDRAELALNPSIEAIGKVDEDEYAKQDEERKRDKVEGLVFLFFFVQVCEACRFGPVGEARFYIQEKGDDRYDSIADTGDDVKEEQHLRYVWWMSSPLR
jgi:hypothetical protein